jgi:hypothetical protein
MFYKNYSAPASCYSDHNVYSAQGQDQWSQEKEEKAVKCNSCRKKCTDAFLSVDYNGFNVANYCSKKCWGNINKE